MPGEGGISLAVVLLVVFPVDIVQVAGQPCLAKHGEEWRKTFWQDCPVRLNAANGCAYSYLVPPYTTELAGNGFICQVQMHVGRQVSEVCGAFGIAQNMKLSDLWRVHQPPGEPHGYIEDAHRFSGCKTLIGECQQ